jgi:hypothetical protein
VSNLRFASAVVLCAALAVGCGAAASPSASPSPSVALTSASPAAASHSASPEVGPSNPASSSAAGAGTERLIELAGAPTVLEPTFPDVLITLPDGWTGIGGWAFHRANAIAVQFWNVDQVYGHPCQWEGTLTRPGPTVDDLANALVDRPLRNATKPIGVTLDGYSGKYLEWSVPSDADFSKCDTDAGVHYFESWTAHGGEGDRYHQGPGQVDRLWILDVRGSRVVIDAFSMPSAKAAQIDELLAVVNSINFER